MGALQLEQPWRDTDLPRTSRAAFALVILPGTGAGDELHAR